MENNQQSKEKRGKTMTLQQRLLASAKELVRLLEESQKEHEEKIRERKKFMHALDMYPSKSGKLKPHKPAPIHIAVDHEYQLPYLYKEDSIRKHAASQLLDALQEAFRELSFELETLLHDTRNVRAEQVMRDFAFELKVDIQKSRVCIRIDQEIDGN